MLLGFVRMLREKFNSGIQMNGATLKQRLS